MPKRADGLRRGERDVGQLSGVGVRVDGAVAVHEDAVGQQHEEHARRDGDARRVRMISKAGRIVAAVVCAAPDTIPSARPLWTIMVPK
jgi:hypothetical protein